MGKCPVCNRKAKRNCLLEDITSICSACCGSIRKENTCSKCSYYQPPRRNYKQITAYSPNEMEASLYLQNISEVIESAICDYDYEASWSLKDPTAIRIIELLLDQYHFQDTQPKEENETILLGFKQVAKQMQKNLKKIPNEEIIKTLGAIYFVAVRRTRGNREYLNIIKQYVGLNTEIGRMRVI
ncbi:hypothetical protein [Cysteiniphilum litorale]|uniref:Uncharacterized protein n=2 Tax=Cysteiniphilum TaxID=2056696 RepID=A0A8J3EA28_9GAMM|nr:hypothetical protein [Cysteiniphilum litorale]GGG05434.1 hypothetical protein GCM10010995_23640 [Cysteiniphilum litorale]